jgi:hypothetical protein
VSSIGHYDHVHSVDRTRDKPKPMLRLTKSLYLAFFFFSFFSFLGIGTLVNDAYFIIHDVIMIGMAMV